MLYLKKINFLQNKIKFGGGKILTKIAIHILMKKGELLIWRKNGHFPHCGDGWLKNRIFK
jgi:hypothetical protein